MYRSHVDGIPVLRFGEAGQLHAALRFGVGTRDETYRTLGISRLIANLAADATRAQLRSTAQLAVSSGLEETWFTASGTQEEVSDCLRELCVVLSDLPTERLGQVAEALHGERTHSLDPRALGALNARYGSQAAGLEGHEDREHHLPTVEMLLDHAAAWFTRANAVLTLIGPDPADLHLPLPTGERPHHSAPKARYSGASWTFRDIDGITLSFESSVESMAVAIAHRILQERVSAALTFHHGSAVPVGTATALNDSVTTTRLLLTPPVSSGTVQEVAATVWAQALGLAMEDPTPAEVNRHRSSLEDTPAHLRILGHAAREELFGTPFLDEDSRRRTVEGITPRDVRDSWQQALAQIQLVIPHGVILDLVRPDGGRLWCTSCWIWDELPPWGTEFREPLTKRAFRRAADRHWAVLTPRSVVTCWPTMYHELRFDDVLALERWGPVRKLIGRCGCTVEINPVWYHDGQRLVRALDENVPAELAFDGAVRSTEVSGERV